MEKIRILLVDDHQIMLDGIRALLNSDPQFELVGEATRAKQALELIPSLKPAVVITDLHMPEMNGVEFTRLVRHDFPAVKVLVLSMSDDGGLISDAVSAGISGYVMKNTGKEELRDALLKIHAGGTFYSAEIGAILARNLLKVQQQSTAKLTQREVEIVQLIAKEYSNEQIANALFISERTVETHRKNIFRKTGTKSVVGLLKYAMENRLIG